MQDNDSSANDPQGPGHDDWLNAAAAWWSQALSEAGGAFRARLDAQARIPAPDPPPMTGFDLAFQEHVGPRLLRLVTAIAPMMAADVYTFPEARRAVWREAWRNGAGYLSDGAQSGWLDWIGSELITRSSEPWPEGLISLERLRFLTGVACRGEG